MYHNHFVEPKARPLQNGPLRPHPGNGNRDHIYIYIHTYILVVGLEHLDYVPFHIWDVILPIDEIIFFKMVKTTNQYIYIHLDLLCLSSHFGKENLCCTYLLHNVYGCV